MLPRFDRILLPTDMSEIGKAAFRWGAFFRETVGAHLTVLYVYDPAGHASLQPSYSESGLMDRLSGDLAEFITATLGADPEGIDVRIVSGAASRAILETANEINADLIVAGTHARTGIRRALLGSVTERVMSETDHPILTITPMAAKKGSASLKTILCPTNFTPVAHDALQYASELARLFSAELIVTHVIEDESRLMTNSAVATAFSEWITPETRSHSRFGQMVLTGDPAVAVLDLAEDISADLIVVGAQHRLFSDTSVVGATTETIARLSRTPVLTVIRTHVIEESVTTDQHEVPASA